MLSSTTLINALIIALANVLCAFDGAMPMREVNGARALLCEVFSSPSNGSYLKISAIKFVRSHTDMDLKTAKDFVEQYVFIDPPTEFDVHTIARMQEFVGVSKY